MIKQDITLIMTLEIIFLKYIHSLPFPFFSYCALFLDIFADYSNKFEEFFNKYRVLYLLVVDRSIILLL